MSILHPKSMGNRLRQHQNPSRQHKHLKRQQGFSLIELSIALTIIGVIVAGGLSLSTSMVDRQAYVETNNQMDEVETAIAAYVAINGHIPCPSDPALAINAAGFGTETDCSIAAVGGVIDAGAVRIGGLPVRELGLRDRFSADDYGNRYTYAVTEIHTTSAGFADNTPAGDGAVTIQDGNSANIVTDASYAIISHGGDGKGAYRYETASTSVACGAVGLDVQNCDGDTNFRDTRFNRGTVVANFYDDSIRWRRKELISSSGASGSGLWVENGTAIYNANTGNVGVGTSNPEQRFEVEIPTAAGVSPVMVLDSNNSGANAGGSLEFKNTAGGYLASIEAHEDTLDGFLTLRVSNDGILTNTNTATGANSIFVINQLGAVGVNTAPISSGLGDRGVSIGSFGVGIEIPNSTNGIRVNSSSGGLAYYGEVSGGAAGSAAFQAGLTSANKTGFQVYYTTLDSSTLFLGSGTGTNAKGLDFTLGGTGSTGAFITMNASNSTGINVSAPNTANSILGISSTVAGTTSIALSAINSNSGFRCDMGNAADALNCTGDVNVTGNIAASGTITPSDRRLKKDITALDKTQGLHAINALKPVTYHWKDTARKGLEIGFIAQDVEKIFPHLVHEMNGHKIPDTDDTAKGLQYDRLIAPMALAIQQLSQQNKALESRLKALEAQLANRAVTAE
jgi:prepilin-type N-terminal cleavage/methylation domain-containing protein